MGLDSTLDSSSNLLRLVTLGTGVLTSPSVAREAG